MMRACLASWLPLLAAWLATSSAGAAPGHVGFRVVDDVHLARLVGRQGAAATATPGPVDPAATPVPAPAPSSIPSTPVDPALVQSKTTGPAQTTPTPASSSSSLASVVSTPIEPGSQTTLPASVVASATPTSSTPTTLGVPSPAWKTKKCEGDIVNAVLSPDKRWAAADASTALTDMMTAWRAYTPRPGEVQFEFSQFASWFFGGPENMRCTELLDVPCSSILRCEDTTWPAGYLVLNSFAKMHQFQRRYYVALDQVQQEIQAEIDLFAESFSVRHTDDSQAKTSRIALNVIYGMVSVGQAWANDLFVQSAVWGSFLTEKMRTQITYTGSYSVFAGYAVAKDALLPTADSLPLYGKLGSYFGHILDGWKTAQVAYLKALFGGADANSTAMLAASIDNGMLGSAPDDVDFPAMAAHLKNLIYPHLMMAAWHMHPDAQQPFLLQTGFPCDAKTLEKGQRNNGLKAWLSDDDHHRAAACYKGALWYFLDVNHGKDIDVKVSQYHPSIKPSVGATLRSLFGVETLDGERWGNVTKQDLIESAYGAYLQGGRRNGAFHWEQMSVSPDKKSPLWYGKGIRLPGYVSLPICRSVWNLIANIAMGKPGDQKHPNWPCELAGTNYGSKWEPISYSWDDKKKLVLWDGRIN